jgi:hypothetical protein
VNFDVKDPSFKLDDLLKLELHKFEDEVGEIVDCAQKEEKMELALVKLKETWGRVEFQFAQFKDTPVRGPRSSILSILYLPVDPVPIGTSPAFCLPRPCLHSSTNPCRAFSPGVHCQAGRGGL